MNITIGTRGSRLALAQAEEVRRRLLEAQPELSVELQIIKTQGDKRLDLALDASGDKGLFTTELEQALIAGHIDLAVHSLKDLPVTPAEGTILGAILPRELPADALLGGYTLSSLPIGAVVGTSSPRRVAQLRDLRPDLDLRPIRGNVETRIAKMKAGEYDAIVMAVAGLRRLGLEDEISEILPYQILTPAPGQAAIAVQLRAGDIDTMRIAQLVDCPATAYAVHTERRLLQLIGGGCALPLGCVCHRHEGSDTEYELEVYYRSGHTSVRLHRTLTESSGESCLREVCESLGINPQ